MNQSSVLWHLYISRIHFVHCALIDVHCVWSTWCCTFLLCLIVNIVTATVLCFNESSTVFWFLYILWILYWLMYIVFQIFNIVHFKSMWAEPFGDTRSDPQLHVAPSSPFWKLWALILILRALIGFNSAGGDYPCECDDLPLWVVGRAVAM